MTPGPILRQIPVTRNGTGWDIVCLQLHGPVPTKKNKLRPRRGRGRAHRYDADTKAAIQSLTIQARAQWGPRRALDNPNVHITMFVTTRRQDRDGILTTVLDCLKTAGVIHDDSIAWFNGELTLGPAIIVARGLQEVRVELKVPAGTIKG